MVAAILRGVRHMGNQLAARLPRKSGGGCGIHFDGGGMQFVRVTRLSGGTQCRLDAYGSAVLEDGVLNGAQIAKPEALARRIEEMLERSGVSVQELQGDTIIMALPSHGLRMQVIDYPSDLPPRAVRAWCERRAALLLPGDGNPDWRSRVGVTWADPGSHRLRLYACEAALVDDRVAVLEMSGLRVHAVDAAHKAARRAFLWSRPAANHGTRVEPGAGANRSGTPVALLQVDAHDVDLAVFDAQICVSDFRERFDGVGAHPEALASVVYELSAKLPVAPLAIYIAAQSATPGELAAICDAIAARCDVVACPFDPLNGLLVTQPESTRFQAVAQRSALAVACGLALRAVAVSGASCE